MATTRTRLQPLAIAKHRIWKAFFQGEEARMNLQGSPLRRVGPNQYMFIHKSYQEYFAAQKMVREIISKPKGAFLQAIPSFALNKKLLNDEPPIIRFIADRLEAGGTYKNLTEAALSHPKSFQKNPSNIHVAAANAITILNARWGIFCR